MGRHIDFKGHVCLLPCIGPAFVLEPLMPPNRRDNCSLRPRQWTGSLQRPLDEWSSSREVGNLAFQAFLCGALVKVIPKWCPRAGGPHWKQICAIMVAQGWSTLITGWSCLVNPFVEPCPAIVPKLTCSIDQPWLREKMIKIDQSWSSMINLEQS